MLRINQSIGNAQRLSPMAVPPRPRPRVGVPGMAFSAGTEEAAGHQMCLFRPGYVLGWISASCGPPHWTSGTRVAGGPKSRTEEGWQTVWFVSCCGTTQGRYVRGYVLFPKKVSVWNTEKGADPSDVVPISSSTEGPSRNGSAAQGGVAARPQHPAQTRPDSEVSVRDQRFFTF